MINLILCGGSGTRLWPMSRKNLPKQFYPLVNGKSLFELTVERNLPISDYFWIASNKAQLTAAELQLKGCKVDNFSTLIETVGRNTAPAILLTCLQLDKNELVFVTPSDHLLRDLKQYYASIKVAKDLASQGFLVTFGIQPNYPETGFGYIEANGNEVISFKEKPDYATASDYVQSGRYYWNSGMVLFRVDTLIQEMKLHSPELLRQCEEALQNKIYSERAFEVAEPVMQSIESISIDYALLEKSENVKVVPCNPGWSDLGSFDSIYNDFSENDRTNVVLGQQTSHLLESQGNLIIGNTRTISVIDIENMIIVDTPDALLITKRGSGQKVKELIPKLSEGLL